MSRDSDSKRGEFAVSKTARKVVIPPEVMKAV